uniref:MARVEL domain-containing protein n=1 Tax=Strigamia maritima TaxID=126957 RepID=T1IV20_STRMM
MATAENDGIPRNVRTPTISTGTFPSYHTTMTETNAQNTTCRFDPTYLRSLPGILKLIQITFNVVGFICVVASRGRHLSRGNWFSFVSGVGFTISQVLLLIHVFDVPRQLATVPWLIIEIIACSLWTLLYTIAASLVAAYASHISEFGIAAFVGFAATIAYGYNAYITICKFRSNYTDTNQPNDTNNRTPKNI